MRGRFVRLAACAGLLVLASAAQSFAQDFSKSYSLPAGGSITVRNVSGDVTLTGYDGQQVMVTATKVGEDLDMVEVEDLSSGNRVDLRAKYPNNCHRCNVSVNFDIKVPRSTRYQVGPVSTASGDIRLTGVNADAKVTTASGNVTVSDCAGDIHASTASGEVQVRNVAGTVNASSASGDVDVEIDRLEGAGDMKFSSASGDVKVRLPSSADADVSMSTASGRIQTNFPIEVRESKYGSGSRARGRLGSGARMLQISTASGDVSLMSN